MDDRKRQRDLLRRVLATSKEHGTRSEAMRQVLLDAHPDDQNLGLTLILLIEEFEDELPETTTRD